jgi:hypothetical protein
MNIFFLHRDPSRAAKAQCDKHVVKMVLETTQMLSTAARRHGYDVGYMSAYPKHPMTIWVGDTWDNFNWTMMHGEALSSEYTFRYKKFHKCHQVLQEISLAVKLSSKNINDITTPPQCMPDEFKCDDYVRAYRNFYVHKIGGWKFPPKWFQSLDADPYYANV